MSGAKRHVCVATATDEYTSSKAATLIPDCVGGPLDRKNASNPDMGGQGAR